jgi:hypothetical protein
MTKKGQSIESLIKDFFGDIQRWPIEPDGLNFTQDMITRICTRIHQTGDCLWHAEFIVMGWDKCHCAKCSPVNGGVGQ